MLYKNTTHEHLQILFFCFEQEDPESNPLSILREDYIVFGQDWKSRFSVCKLILKIALETRGKIMKRFVI